jgi:hypothetical protein
VEKETQTKRNEEKYFWDNKMELLDRRFGGTCHLSLQGRRISQARKQHEAGSRKFIFYPRFEGSVVIQLCALQCVGSEGRRSEARELELPAEHCISFSFTLFFVNFLFFLYLVLVLHLGYTIVLSLLKYPLLILFS